MKPNTLRRLSSEFVSMVPKTANACGRKLRSLRDQRNKATYILSAKIDKIEAESSILEITELLDELSRDKSIGAEILNYQ